MNPLALAFQRSQRLSTCLVWDFNMPWGFWVHLMFTVGAGKVIT